MTRNLKLAILPYSIGLIVIGLLGLNSYIFIFSFAKGIVVYLMFVGLTWVVRKMLPTVLINERVHLKLFFMSQPHAGIIIYVIALLLTIAIGALDYDANMAYYTSVAATFGFHSVLAYYKAVGRLSAIEVRGPLEE